MRVHVGFVVDKVALGQVFSPSFPSTAVLPCQYHYTSAQYSFTHLSSALHKFTN